MKRWTLFSLYFFLAVTAFAQENKLVIRGTIRDAKTNSVLPNTSIEIKGKELQMVATEEGTFQFFLPPDAENDSVEFSYVGYKTFKASVASLPPEAEIKLQSLTVELKTVTVTSRSFKVKDIDKALRRVKGNLFAFETETTNGLYNLFLSFLEEQGNLELFKQCDYDLSRYDGSARSFFIAYVAPFKAPLDKKDTTVKNYSDFPAVNVSHGAAKLFCQWLTEQYNTSTGKKKFKNVKFRLPTVKEWQIAALGYDKFQSWNLTENKAEVLVPGDTLAEMGKGEKKIISIDSDILYPWWPHYHIRKKPVNLKNCYLGNFKAYAVTPPCPWGPLPNHDGWTRMAKTACYFPNGFGLYDVVGNVAEMVDEFGKAVGGSWNEPPSQATIHSIKNYKKPGDTVGFRVFMDATEN
jgi:formylglycine-generating enzyme required for sulfatase activity